MKHTWGNEWSRSPHHLGGSDPLVCKVLSAHGVERGAPPAAPGVLFAKRLSQ